MTTIIVANGPIKGQGEKIDSHDTVIRMHHANISSLVKDVGSKMTIWVSPRGLIRDWMDIPFKNIEQAREIWTFNPERCSGDGPNGFLRTSFGNKIVVADNGFVKNCYSMLEGPHPTKGLLTILFALRHYKPPIFITGFSHYEKNCGFFWNPHDEHKPTANDPQKEKLIIKQMIEEGKVKCL